MAVLPHMPLFWIFTNFNMIAMSRSAIACGVMMMTLIFYHKLAQLATAFAIRSSIAAFLTVPVAFMAAVRLVVANNSALAIVITVTGAIYTLYILSTVLLVYIFIIFNHQSPLFARFALQILTKVMDDLEIAIEADDGSWRQRSKERMEELKNTQFPIQEAPRLLHKELIRKKEVMVNELYAAVVYGDVENFVRELEQVCTRRNVSLSAIFDQVTWEGNSLLHVAAHVGKEKIAELICDHFPELLTRRNITGDTALHVAIRSEQSTTVTVILSQLTEQEGVKVEEVTRSTNEYEDTPLHEAVHSGHPGIVEDILHADESVVHYLNKKSKRSPLYLAAVYGNQEILNLLLQTPFPADQPLPQCHGNSPLHAAILESKHVIIKEILAKKSELVYLRDEDGNTPLHYAAYIGYVEGVRILLKNSFEKSDQTALERNKKGHLPIHLACKRGHLEVIKDFLRQLPNLNILNQKGQNVLHIAAKNGKSNVVRHLLRNGMIDQFTINQKDTNGNTPLHVAAINLFPKVLLYITEDKRTNVNLTNNEGLTARDIAWLAVKVQLTVRKYVSFIALRYAGVPSVKVKNIWHSRRQQIQPKRESRLKNLINSFLVAATLMVTVTFAAAFTVPGGVYSSEDPNPKNRGMAVLAHKPLFWIFTTFNMIAMYSSASACGVMLMALVSDHIYARHATICAIVFLIVAFLMVPVAFMAAVLLVVANNSMLTLVITMIGFEYTSAILLVVFLIQVLILFSHQSSPIARFVLQKFPCLIDYDDKPGDSSSKIAKRDKDKVEDKDG